MVWLLVLAVDEITEMWIKYNLFCSETIKYSVIDVPHVLLDGALVAEIMAEMETEVEEVMKSVMHRSDLIVFCYYCE